MHSGFTGFKGFTGFNGRSGFRGFSGIGEGVIIPDDAFLYYLFSQEDFDHAKTEQVDGVNVVDTTRVEELNVEQTMTGQVIPFGANIAGFDRGIGMSVPPAATNVVEHSEDLENAMWLKSDATVTGGEISPNGDLTANKIDFTSVGGFVRQITTVNGDGTFANGSFWLRAGTTDKCRLLILADSGGGGQETLNIVLTTEWRRYDIPADWSAIVSGDFARIRILPDGETGTLFAWGGQITLSGLNKSPYIRTTTMPATRDATLSGIDATVVPTDNVRILFEVDSLNLSSGTATLMKSGDMSVTFDAGSGNLIAAVGATTDSIAVADINLLTSGAFIRRAGSVIVEADGIESGVGAASAAPVYDASISMLSDGVIGHFEGSPLIVSALVEPA